MNALVSYLTGRDVLILSIMPIEGSILAYMVLIIVITTINQLEGLAGYTPVMMPFCLKKSKILFSLIDRQTDWLIDSPWSGWHVSSTMSLQICRCVWEPRGSTVGQCHQVWRWTEMPLPDEPLPLYRLKAQPEDWDHNEVIIEYL